MKPLVLVPQFFGSTVFDRRTSRYLPFDAETTALLVRSTREPFDAIIDASDDERVERFFEHFYSRDFFGLDMRFSGTVLDVPVPDDHLVGPLALHLEIAASCNLRCAHCFAGELPRKERALTLDEIDELFATLAKMGTFRIGLTGGEPLLRRDVLDIIDCALAHGLCPCITTNGLLLTEPIARELGRRELVWLNVSLDGATAASNDRVRGEGTFDRVLEKLQLLGRYARFTLAFTITSENSSEVMECAELARRVGAHTAVFRPLYPVGIAREHLELMPSFSQYSRALRQLADAHDLRSIDPFGPDTRAEQQAVIVQNYGCGAGNLVCSVSMSGDVNPCSFLGSGQVAANVRDVPFDRIWHESRTFRSIRGLPGDGTGTATFGGGCRARSLVFAGDINAPDPWLTSHEQLGGVHPLVVLRRNRQ